MNTAVNEIAQSFFKRSLQDCSLDELGQMVHQYPYFGPAQLLLAKKLQQDNSSLYEVQVQKASLYVQNRPWLNLLLNDDHEQEIYEPAKAVNSQVKDKEQNEAPAAIEQTPAEPGDDIDKTTDEKVNVTVEGEQTAGDVVPDSDLVFEPYHTVDYFASQGIKFREEDKPKDRFSQQLKSFTEWLKTMKRIPVSELTAGTETSGEKKVEQLAEHSLAEREVVTEAMAEVWEKQGNREKAEEIYRKLSLLDPPKSSYFAAKIEALK